jgi:hypothetical protein
VSAYQPPDAKLDKVPELFGDSLMPDSSIPYVRCPACLDDFRTDVL